MVLDGLTTVFFHPGFIWKAWKSTFDVCIFLGFFEPRPSEIIAKNQIKKEIWRIFGQIWHFREQDKDDYVHFWWRKLFLEITIALYSTNIILPARKYTSNPAFNSRKWRSCTVLASDWPRSLKEWGRTSADPPRRSARSTRWPKLLYRSRIRSEGVHNQ